MKNKKTNKIVIFIIISIIIIVSALIFILNYSTDESSLSILEKKWISDNKDKVLDISVYNNIPLYGKNGEGISFDILESFSKEYNISFNKTSYLVPTNENLEEVSYKILSYNSKPGPNDILMYEEPYVIIGKDNIVIDDTSNLNDVTICTLKSDLDTISNYIDNNTVTYSDYDNITSLLEAYSTDSYNYMVIPMNMYLDTILSHDNMHIIYHISEMTNKYVLSINNNERLLSIMKKYYKKFQETEYDELYSINYINLFFTSKNISEHEKASYNGNVYTYGFVKNMPFEFISNKKYVGILSNYIKSFAKIMKVDFKYSEYKSIAKLVEAIKENEIDMSFATYDTTNIKNMTETISPFKEEYAVVSKQIFPVSSLKSLKGKNVITIKNSYIYEELRSNNVSVTGYNNIEDLLINMTDNSILVIDKETYDYYKTKKFSNYYNLYTGGLELNYKFILKNGSSNKTFNELFNFYITTLDYDNVKFDYNANYSITNPDTLNKTLRYVFVSLVGLFLVTLIVVGIIRKRKKNIIIKKEERIKYIDIMTSLKNRNYLNHNINKWDDNTTYPQAVIIIDLNDIKIINDEHGREEGDMVIKKAASVLIVSQQENTDIIRTDGNEFLIYMVGYEEREVISYIRKINKDLKELPYEYGASIGYSMITDDIKTIDDAIQEATIKMRELKVRE